MGRWLSLWFGLAAVDGPEVDAVTIGVQPTEFSGDTSVADRKALDTAVGDGLTNAGLSTVPVAVGTPDCDAACQARVAQAQYVVKAKVHGESRLFDIELEARHANDGTLAASSKHACKPCGQNEVRELIAREVGALGSRVAELDATPAILTVSSEPDGAEVLVDGTSVGHTPIELKLRPGQHEVALELADHTRQTRTFKAVAGVTEAWSAQLTPIPARPDQGLPPPPPPGPERLWPTGWALVGTGVASLAVGVTFLVLHHRPYRSRCAGEDFDAQNDLCRFRWTSMPQGAALTAIGGALVVTGAVLATLGRKRRRSMRAASVGLQRGGATLTLQGRF